MAAAKTMPLDDATLSRFKKFLSMVKGSLQSDTVSWPFESTDARSLAQAALTDPLNQILGTTVSKKMYEDEYAFMVSWITTSDPAIATKELLFVTRPALPAVFKHVLVALFAAHVVSNAASFKPADTSKVFNTNAVKKIFSKLPSGDSMVGMWFTQHQQRPWPWAEKSAATFPMQKFTAFKDTFMRSFDWLLSSQMRSGGPGLINIKTAFNNEKEDQNANTERLTQWHEEFPHFEYESTGYLLTFLKLAKQSSDFDADNEFHTNALPQFFLAWSMAALESNSNRLALFPPFFLYPIWRHYIELLADDVNRTRVRLYAAMACVVCCLWPPGSMTRPADLAPLFDSTVPDDSLLVPLDAFLTLVERYLGCGDLNGAPAEADQDAMDIDSDFGSKSLLAELQASPQFKAFSQIPQCQACIEALQRADAKRVEEEQREALRREEEAKKKRVMQARIEEALDIWSKTTYPVRRGFVEGTQQRPYAFTPLRGVAPRPQEVLRAPPPTAAVQQARADLMDTIKDVIKPALATQAKKVQERRTYALPADWATDVVFDPKKGVKVTREVPVKRPPTSKAVPTTEAEKKAFEEEQEEKSKKVAAAEAAEDERLIAEGARVLGAGSDDEMESSELMSDLELLDEDEEKGEDKEEEEEDLLPELPDITQPPFELTDPLAIGTVRKQSNRLYKQTVDALEHVYRQGLFDRIERYFTLHADWLFAGKSTTLGEDPVAYEEHLASILGRLKEQSATVLALDQAYIRETWLKRIANGVGPILAQAGALEIVQLRKHQVKNGELAMRLENRLDPMNEDILTNFDVMKTKTTQPNNPKVATLWAAIRTYRTVAEATQALTNDTTTVVNKVQIDIANEKTRYGTETLITTGIVLCQRPLTEVEQASPPQPAYIAESQLHEFAFPDEEEGNPLHWYQKLVRNPGAYTSTAAADQARIRKELADLLGISWHLPALAHYVKAVNVTDMLKRAQDDEFVEGEGLRDLPTRAVVFDLWKPHPDLPLTFVDDTLRVHHPLVGIVPLCRVAKAEDNETVIVVQITNDTVMTLLGLEVLEQSKAVARWFSSLGAKAPKEYVFDKPDVWMHHAALKNHWQPYFQPFIEAVGQTEQVENVAKDWSKDGQAYEWLMAIMMPSLVADKNRRVQQTIIDHWLKILAFKKKIQKGKYRVTGDPDPSRWHSDVVEEVRVLIEGPKNMTGLTGTTIDIGRIIGDPDSILGSTQRLSDVVDIMLAERDSLLELPFLYKEMFLLDTVHNWDWSTSRGSSAHGDAKLNLGKHLLSLGHMHDPDFSRVRLQLMSGELLKALKLERGLPVDEIDAFVFSNEEEESNVIRQFVDQLCDGIAEYSEVKKDSSIAKDELKAAFVASVLAERATRFDPVMATDDATLEPDFAHIEAMKEIGNNDEVDTGGLVLKDEKAPPRLICRHGVVVHNHKVLATAGLSALLVVLDKARKHSSGGAAAAAPDLALLEKVAGGDSKNNVLLERLRLMTAHMLPTDYLYLCGDLNFAFYLKYWGASHAQGRPVSQFVAAIEANYAAVQREYDNSSDDESAPSQGEEKEDREEESNASYVDSEDL